MRLERLQEEPVPAKGVETRQSKVEISGGVVEITSYPVPKERQDDSTFDLLNRHLIGWNVTDDQGLHAPLNADVILSLSPDAKEAFRDAILARPKAKATDKPAEKPAEPAHGSFEPVDEKPPSGKEKP